MEGHIRAACLREYQFSIKKSVKQLLEDKIRKFGLETFFHVTGTEIAGPYDSLIIFQGLQDHTADSIKSLEGFNRCWVEEAQVITQRSLDLLTPTFRTGSQLSFSWNPNQPTDPVDKLFRENIGDPDFAFVFVTYEDNPWFPDELRRDMERDRRRDPDKYNHVWLGKYQVRTGARVFTNWRIGEEKEFNHEVERYYYGADWGFSIDPTVLVRCYIVGRTLYVDREAYQIGCEIDDIPALFDQLDGGQARRWPIVADSERPDTISYLRRHGYPKIQQAVKGIGSVDEGVEFLQNFDIVVHPSCRHTADELSSYSYKIDKRTEQILPQLEDKDNHVIDALRYAIEAVRRSVPVFHTPEQEFVIDGTTLRR